MSVSNNKHNVIRVLFLAAEADPIIKVGGLGDVAGSLPYALKQLPSERLHGQEIDIRMVIPFHSGLNIDRWNPELAASFDVAYPGGEMKAQAFKIIVNDLPVYVLSAGPIGRPGPVYSMVTQEDGDKFVFFSLAALELTRFLDWQPDIVHANDWHTAAAIYALSLKRETDPFFSSTHTVLTLHNLPFMGAGVEDAMERFGLPPSSDPRLPNWARLFPLPLGLLTADRVVAVSPTYAREILTPEFGCSLENFLTTRQDVISGILNGLDQTVWDPRKDPYIAANFSDENLENKKICKKALMAEFDMIEKPETPLMILISRMDQQKGIDIAVEGLRGMMDFPWQAILLGSGDPTLERRCLQLQEEFPDRVRAAIRFDPLLSHRMYAGADILLQPSRYEPCGLSQMIAMRYGTLPVASAVGGLVDTIQDAKLSKSPTGFLFRPVSAEALNDSIKHAIYTYQKPEEWKAMQSRGMRLDFTWNRSALDYAKLYFKLRG